MRNISYNQDFYWGMNDVHFLSFFMDWFNNLN